MGDKKPTTTWTGFLSSAPYFTSAIMSAVSDQDLQDYNNLVRAVFYYDVFDGEVCNGGVMQYFFNQAFYLPDFEHAAEIAGSHPALSEGAAFMKEVHTAWESVRDKVAEARKTDDWPEDLFSDGRFEALEEKFFSVNQRIRLGVYAAICTAPEDYLTILPEARDAEYRFVDGFPAGPNIVKSKRGESVVWFTADRMHVDVESGGFFQDGSSTREWVDFRTGASGRRQFQAGRLTSSQTQQNMWDRHGLRETYTTEGGIEHTSLSLSGEELITQYEDGLTLANKAALKSIIKRAKDMS